MRKTSKHALDVTSFVPALGVRHAAVSNQVIAEACRQLAEVLDAETDTITSISIEIGKSPSGNVGLRWTLDGPEQPYRVVRGGDA